MCPPCHTPRGAGADHKGRETGEDLHEEPDPQVYNGWQADESAKDENGDEGDHARGGEQHKISAHHCGDGTAGAQGWDGGSGVKNKLQQSGAETTEDIKEQITKRTQPVFDVVAKDHQEPHVAEQMIPTAVQEHVRDERQQGGGMAQVDAGGGQRVRSYEPVGKIGRRIIFHQKNQHVGNDDQPVHDGEMGCALRITDRNHKHHFRVKFIDFSIIRSYELCKRIVL